MGRKHTHILLNSYYFIVCILDFLVHVDCTFLKLIPDSTLLSLFCLFWCPYMMINVSVQDNGGFLPEIILLTLCDFVGEPF